MKSSVFFDSRKLVWFLLLLGIALRMSHYLSNRSLWIDEAALSLNIVNRSYGGLMETLDYKQVAPMGYLWVSKFLVEICGNHEYSLRGLSILGGIASLFLFWKLASLMLERRAGLVALFFFVVATELVYFAAEAKQYTTEMVTGLALLLVMVYFIKGEYSILRGGLLGLVGGAGLWMSHTALFFLAGFGLYLVGKHARNKEGKQLAYLIVPLVLWLVNFGIIYHITLSDPNIERQRATDVYQANYMPLPPTSLSDLYWLPRTVGQIFLNPGRFSSSNISLAIVSFFLGYYLIFRRRKDYFCLLMFPVLFMLLASGLRFFPVQNRLVVFLMPILLLGVGEGVEYIRLKTAKPAPFISVGFMVIMLFVPLLRGTKLLIYPPARLEIKPLLAHLQEHHQAGDQVYLYYRALKPFWYYAERYGLSDIERVEGINAKESLFQHVEMLEPLRGHERVWVLLYGTDEEEQFFRDYLNSIGRELEVTRAKDVSLHLYDLEAEG